MLDRAPGESFLNPMDIKSLRDFNLFALIVTVLLLFWRLLHWQAPERIIWFWVFRQC